jgi:hypothetical protein
MLTRKKGILLFLIGAPAATVGDWFHVHTGTTFYPSEVYRWYIAGIPFWIPILFGLASATLGLVYHGVKKLLGAERFNEGAMLKDVLLAGLLYMALHALSGYICPWGFPATDIVLAIPVLLVWFTLDRSVGGALVCLLAGLLGPGAEILLVHLGIFSFSDKAYRLLGVATWLPWIHMAGALAIGRFVERGHSHETQGD